MRLGFGLHDQPQQKAIATKHRDEGKSTATTIKIGTHISEKLYDDSFTDSVLTSGVTLTSGIDG